MITIWNKHDPATPKNALYIGRGSIFGNPFVIGLHGTRDEVCDLYEQRLEKHPALKSLFQEKLQGVTDVVCFCAPRRCHGEYLRRIQDEPIIHYCLMAGDHFRIFARVFKPTRFGRLHSAVFCGASVPDEEFRHNMKRVKAARLAK